MVVSGRSFELEMVNSGTAAFSYVTRIKPLFKRRLGSTGYAVLMNVTILKEMVMDTRPYVATEAQNEKRLIADPRIVRDAEWMLALNRLERLKSRYSVHHRW